MAAAPHREPLHDPRLPVRSCPRAAPAQLPPSQHVVPGLPGSRLRPVAAPLLVAPEAGVRPRLLDLFCGAGGAAMGYHRAGFDVTGVDVKPQPRYPFAFAQADAMEYPLDGFDAIHASPPCQDHSPLRSVAGEHGTGWMLDATLARLASHPAPWVVENVGSAHNRADYLLCGEMFGLRTVRHRRFTLDPRIPCLLAVPEHRGHQRPTSTKNRVSALAEGHNLSITGNVGIHAGPLCMGIDWMNGDELSQAIPPAYTEYIGRQLMDVLTGAAA